MRRIWITLSLVALLLAALAAPGGASASHLSRADFKSASKYCKALRAEMGTKAFKREFGKGKRQRRALRGCIARRGVVETVTVPLPPASTTCPPGTVPEPPFPVRAFATAVCVPDPAAAPPVACDEDGDEEGDEKGDEKGRHSDDDEEVEASDNEDCDESDDDQSEDEDDDDSDDD